VNHRFVIASAVLSYFLLASCKASVAPRETHQPAPVMLVTATPAIVMPMKSTLRALGVTVATTHVTIRSPSAGRVIGITLRNGDHVRKGQVIGYVVNREIEAAQAGLEVARKIDQQGAAALAESVNRYSHGGGIPIVAPDSGVVSHPPVTSGQLVADLDPIAELIDPAGIYVEASIPVDQLHLISPGMPATVTTAIRPGAAIPAKVAAMIPTFDPSSATAPIRLDFTTSDSIQDIGAPVEARIVTVTVPDAIAIPISALFQDIGANRYHVFVLGTDGLAHRVDVSTGITEDGEVQVLSGIKAGDQVITSGGYALSDGLRVRIAGAPS
jgi:RND family efflux transporter MFP subunit